VGVEDNNDDDGEGVVAEEYFEEHGELEDPEEVRETGSFDSGLVGGDLELGGAVVDLLEKEDGREDEQDVPEPNVLAGIRHVDVALELVLDHDGQGEELQAQG